MDVFRFFLFILSSFIEKVAKISHGFLQLKKALVE